MDEKQKELIELLQKIQVLPGVINVLYATNQHKDVAKVTEKLLVLVDKL